MHGKIPKIVVKQRSFHQEGTSTSHHQKFRVFSLAIHPLCHCCTYFSVTDNEENDLDVLERILEEEKQDVSIYVFIRIQVHILGHTVGISQNIYLQGKY